MKLSEIAALVGGEVIGDGAVEIAAVSSPASARADTIVFAENAPALATALASGAGAVVASPGAGDLGDRAGVRTEYPKVAFARIAAVLHPEPRPAPGVHPAAVVDDSAILGDDVSIGPTAVIGARAEIGARTAIGPGCHVAEDARIGEGSRLHANVVVYRGVTLGRRVVVHSGAVLGADGFGYVDMPDGTKEKFPQLGTLVVGDDVEIGALTAIDRGALDATVIGDGTKIDNLVQIAHNCEIGRSCAISGQTGIAGTTKLGDRVILGGRVAIADHVTVGDGAILGAGAGVAPKKVLAGGAVYWGIPVRPLREAKRQHMQLQRIGKLIERVEALEKKLAGEEE